MAFNIPEGYVVFTGDNCPACKELKSKLFHQNIVYQEFNVYKDDEALDFLVSQGLRGIPQLFINGVLFNKDMV